MLRCRRAASIRAALGHQPGEVEPGLDESRIELDGARVVMRRLELPAGCPQAVGAVERGDRVARIDGEAALIEAAASA